MGRISHRFHKYLCTVAADDDTFSRGDELCKQVLRAYKPVLAQTLSLAEKGVVKLISSRVHYGTYNIAASRKAKKAEAEIDSDFADIEFSEEEESELEAAFVE